MITTLRIRKQFDTTTLAIKWYSIISILNDFKWSPMELKVIAFTAMKGDISSGGRKEAFCEMFNTNKATLANTVSDLFKADFLIKTQGKTKLHPALVISFEGNILSQLHLVHDIS
jgi:hypothetical protein